MTTIIAIQGDGYAIMGADTQVTYGERAFRGDGQNKIKEKNGLIFGTAGDAYPGQILNFLWIPPINKMNKDPDSFIAEVVIPSMKSILNSNGYDPDKERSADSGVDILLAYEGRVYQLASDFTYLRDKEGLYAIGSGGDYALGYLYAKRESMFSTELVLNRTLRAAIQTSMHFDLNTGGTIDTLMSRNSKLVKNVKRPKTR
jgi:ATP-dependent protease HslVU (ClpYQ) peptidase subunit